MNVLNKITDYYTANILLFESDDIINGQFKIAYIRNYRFNLQLKGGAAHSRLMTSIQNICKDCLIVRN